MGRKSAQQELARAAHIAASLKKQRVMVLCAWLTLVCLYCLPLSPRGWCSHLYCGSLHLSWINRNFTDMPWSQIITPSLSPSLLLLLSTRRLVLTCGFLWRRRKLIEFYLHRKFSLFYFTENRLFPTICSDCGFLCLLLLPVPVHFPSHPHPHPFGLSSKNEAAYKE